MSSVRDDRMADPGERGAFVDSFVERFADSATWRAMLAVGDVLFPGFGSNAKVMRWTDDVGFPVWVSEPGLGLDLSTRVSEHRTLPRFTVRLNGGNAWAPYAAGSRPPVLRPYDGALVIDTLDPRRYHRAVSGPLSPRDISDDDPYADRQSRHGEDEETTGVVIVSDLAAAGKRIVDADALWRQALTVVTETLYDPERPTSDARQVVRALRYVVFLDPVLGLGFCLFVDEARVPWCPLVLTVAQSSVRFLRA